MSANRVIKMVSGKQLSKSIRARGVAKVWPDAADVEVRAQLRTGKTSKDDLIVNLHEYMTWVTEGDDLIITWEMSPSVTEELGSEQWGQLKRGYFNLTISDPGVNDARSVVTSVITIQYVYSTTTPGGNL